MWCSDGNICYDYNSNSLSTTTLIKDALYNFINTENHNFDGSGSGLISSMTSTFPTPDWDKTTCKLHDKSVNSSSYKHVYTSWNYVNTIGKQVMQACGYTNGYLNPVFNASSKVDSFYDLNGLSEVNSYRRIYCIVLYYYECDKNGCKTDTLVSNNYDCSVGLFYVRSIFNNFEYLLLLFTH